MFQETAQENLVRQGHRSLFVVMRIVLPAERHVCVREIDESVIGDRDPMCIASQIMQDMFGTAEWRLGVDYPVFTKQGSEKNIESLLLRQRKAPTIETELLPAKGVLQAGYKLSTKDAA